MARILITHPLENLLELATSVTVTTGTPLDQYGVEHLYSGVWHRGLRITGLDLDVEIALAAPAALAFAALLNSNVDVVARIQGHTAAVWTSPGLDLPFAVPTLKKTGFYTSPYLVPAPAPAAKQFYRLHIAGNGSPIVVGQLFLASSVYILDDTFVHPGAELELVGGRTQYETPAGVKLSYERTTPIATIGGILRTDATAERELVEAWLATTRYGARPFVVVPRDDENDAWVGWLQSDRVSTTPVGLGPHKYDHKLTIEMCARGMSHVDPDEI